MRISLKTSFICAVVSAPVAVEVVRKSKIVSCNDGIKVERSEISSYTKGHQLRCYTEETRFITFVGILLNNKFNNPRV